MTLLRPLIVVALVLALSPVVSTQFGPSTRIGPQTLHVLPITSVTYPGVPYDLADLQRKFLDGGFEHFWLESSDDQFGPFATDILPYQVYDDSAAPLNYVNGCVTTSNTLTIFGNERVDALFGTSPQAQFFTWYYFMEPYPGCNASGRGGSVRITMLGDSTFSVLLHEMGHGLGMSGEGTAQHCTSTGCTVRNYDDIYSIMGGPGGYAPQFSTIRKMAAGWVGAAGQSRVLTVTQSGDYALAPFERGPKGRVVALRTSGSWGTIDLEARVDGNIGRQDRGVILRLGDTLMDLDRTDTGGDDYMLNVGQVFTLSGVTYEVLSFDLSGAVVRITFGGTPPQPPLACSNLRAL